MRSISSYRQRVGHRARNKGSPAEDDWSDGNIKVFVRKRPIFKHELDAYEFDVVTCTSDNTIVVHDARMHNDMKRQLMNHHEFQFDRTFGENVRNDEVYNATAKSLVEIACSGGFSTCLVYGQTGSGKTFTMSSIYEQAAYDLFNQLEELVQRFATPPTVTMSFFEIAGDLCHDLLNKFQPAQLLTGNDGGVHAYPVVEPTVTCAEELIAMIQHGMGVRTTAATGMYYVTLRTAQR
jgi:kinesin family protein 2/24